MKKLSSLLTLRKALFKNYHIIALLLLLIMGVWFGMSVMEGVKNKKGKNKSRTPEEGTTAPETPTTSPGVPYSPYSAPAVPGTVDAVPYIPGTVDAVPLPPGTFKPPADNVTYNGQGSDQRQYTAEVESYSFAPDQGQGSAPSRPLETRSYA